MSKRYCITAQKSYLVPFSDYRLANIRLRDVAYEQLHSSKSVRIRLMRRLDRYILSESFPTLIFSLLLYSSLSILSMTLPRVRWIVGVPLQELFAWLMLQYPVAISQTLPLALLLAVLLTFGQLTSQREILAIRAGGIPTHRLTYGFIILGIVAALLGLALAQWVLPRTNARVAGLWWEMTGNGSSGLWRLVERELQLDEYSLYFEKAGSNNEMYNVRLAAWQGKQLSVIFAEEGRFLEDGLELSNYQLNILDLAIDFTTHDDAINPEDNRDATMVLSELLRADNRSSNPEHSLKITTSESQDELIARYDNGGFEDSRSLRAIYKDIHSTTHSPKERLQARILFQRKLAEPFANFVLLLVAVPLALIFGHNRMVAFGLSLVITLIWYISLTVGQLIAQAGAVPPWLGLWSGNILLAALGLYLLLWRRLRH